MIRKLVIAFMLLGLGCAVLSFWSVKDTPDNAYAATCFLTGERTSGMHKICYYDCLGGTVAITIGGLELCPLSINN